MTKSGMSPVAATRGRAFKSEQNETQNFEGEDAGARERAMLHHRHCNPDMIRPHHVRHTFQFARKTARGLRSPRG
jgi:hypothetical protein